MSNHNVLLCKAEFLFAFFSNFFLAQVFLAYSCYKSGILDHWDLPYLWDELVKVGGMGSFLPWKRSRAYRYSWISLLLFLHRVCRISQCCRAFSAACLSAAGVAASFARLVTRPASHCPSWSLPSQHPQSSAVSNDLLLLSSFCVPE